MAVNFRVDFSYRVYDYEYVEAEDENAAAQQIIERYWWQDDLYVEVTE